MYLLHQIQPSKAIDEKKQFKGELLEPKQSYQIIGDNRLLFYKDYDVPKDLFLSQNDKILFPFEIFENVLKRSTLGSVATAKLVTDHTYNIVQQDTELYTPFQTDKLGVDINQIFISGQTKSDFNTAFINSKFLKEIYEQWDYYIDSIDITAQSKLDMYIKAGWVYEFAQFVTKDGKYREYVDSSLKGVLAANESWVDAIFKKSAKVPNDFKYSDNYGDKQHDSAWGKGRIALWSSETNFELDELKGMNSHLANFLGSFSFGSDNKNVSGGFYINDKGFRVLRIIKKHPSIYTDSVRKRSANMFDTDDTIRRFFLWLFYKYYTVAFPDLKLRDDQDVFDGFYSMYHQNFVPSDVFFVMDEEFMDKEGQISYPRSASRFIVIPTAWTIRFPGVPLPDAKLFYTVHAKNIGNIWNDGTLKGDFVKIVSGVKKMKTGTLTQLLKNLQPNHIILLKDSNLVDLSPSNITQKEYEKYIAEGYYPITLDTIRNINVLNTKGFVTLEYTPPVKGEFDDADALEYKLTEANQYSSPDEYINDKFNKYFDVIRNKYPTLDTDKLDKYIKNNEDSSLSMIDRQHIKALIDKDPNLKYLPDILSTYADIESLDVDSFTKLNQTFRSIRLEDSDTINDLSELMDVRDVIQHATSNGLSNVTEILETKISDIRNEYNQWKESVKDNPLNANEIENRVVELFNNFENELHEVGDDNNPQVTEQFTSIIRDDSRPTFRLIPGELGLSVTRFLDKYRAWYIRRALMGDKKGFDQADKLKAISSFLYNVSLKLPDLTNVLYRVGSVLKDVAEKAAKATVTALAVIDDIFDIFKELRLPVTFNYSYCKDGYSLVQFKQGITPQEKEQFYIDLLAGKKDYGVNLVSNNRYAIIPDYSGTWIGKKGFLKVTDHLKSIPGYVGHFMAITERHAISSPDDTSVMQPVAIYSMSSEQFLEFRDRVESIKNLKLKDGMDNYLNLILSTTKLYDPGLTSDEKAIGASASAVKVGVAIGSAFSAPGGFWSKVAGAALAGIQAAATEATAAHLWYAKHSAEIPSDIVHEDWTNATWALNNTSKDKFITPIYAHLYIPYSGVKFALSFAKSAIKIGAALAANVAIGVASGKVSSTIRAKIKVRKLKKKYLKGRLLVGKHHKIDKYGNKQYDKNGKPIITRLPQYAPNPNRVVKNPDGSNEIIDKLAMKKEIYRKYIGTDLSLSASTAAILGASANQLGSIKSVKSSLEALNKKTQAGKVESEQSQSGYDDTKVRADIKSLKNLLIP